MFKPRFEWLLVLVPVAVVLELIHANEIAIFIVAALAILPLALTMGTATEDLAIRAGPSSEGSSTPPSGTSRS